MAANLGTAWIQVKPSMNGVRGSILSGLRGTGSQFSNNFAGETRKSSGVLTGAVAGAVAAATTKVIQVVSDSLRNFINSASEIQSLRASFQSLTGSVGATNKVMKTLYAFGKQTAFSNEEIQSAGRSFLAVGQNADEMRKSMQLAGDIAGATGANLSQLVLPLTQAFSRGKLQTQDFYQILNSGAGALRGTILQAYKASGGVKDLSEAMSDGEITADILWKAMEMATKKGGFAFQGAIKQAETFNGRMSNLQEAITNVGLKILGVDAETGQVKLGGPFDRLSGAVKSATKLLGEFDINKIGDAFKKLDPNALGQTLGSKLGEALGNIGKFIGSVNWADIGMSIGKQSVAFIFGFLTGLLNFDVEPILKFAAENWWQILLGIATVVFAPAKLFGPIVKGISKIPILGPLVSWILNAVRGAGQFLFPKMTGFFAGLFSKIGAVGTTILNFFKTVFTGLFKILIAPFRLFDTGVTAIFNLFKAFVGIVFRGIVNVIKFLFAPLVNFYAGIFGRIRALIGAAFGAVRSAAMGAWNIIKTGASNAWGFIRSVFGGIGGFFRGVFQGAYNAVSGIWGRISGFFSGIVTKIKNAFSGMANIGKNIVEGLWNGISNMAGWIGGKLKGFSDGVLKGIKDFFGIKSPSRLMEREVGKMIVLGTGRGITRNTKQAVNAAVASSRAILGAFNTQSGFSTGFIPNSQLALAGAGGGQTFHVVNPDPEQTAAIIASRMKLQGA